MQSPQILFPLSYKQEGAGFPFKRFALIYYQKSRLINNRHGEATKLKKSHTFSRFKFMMFIFLVGIKGTTNCLQLLFLKLFLNSPYHFRCLSLDSWYLVSCRNIPDGGAEGLYKVHSIMAHPALKWAVTSGDASPATRFSIASVAYLGTASSNPHTLGKLVWTEGVDWICLIFTLAWGKANFGYLPDSPCISLS